MSLVGYELPKDLAALIYSSEVNMFLVVFGIVEALYSDISITSKSEQVDFGLNVTSDDEIW